MSSRATDDAPTQGTLLSSKQTLWILAALLWFGVSIQDFVTGDAFFGVVSLLLGLASLYRLANP